VLTRNAQFDKELRKLIEQMIEEKKELLSTGLGTIDFPTYKHQVGTILGLRLALEMCDEAMLALERRERN
jgi:hypothetical protein